MITKVFSSLKQTNKSREKIACNLIDTDDKISTNTLAKLSNIKGVTNARLCY